MSCPALLAAIALAAGLAVGASTHVSVEGACAIALEAWIAAAVTCRRTTPWWFVAACAAGFVAAGAAMGVHANEEAVRSPLRRVYDRRVETLADPAAPVRVEGRLREDATPTPYGATLSIDVSRLDGHPVEGGVRIAVGGGLAAGSLREWRAGRSVRLTALLRRALGYRDRGVADEETAAAHRGIALVGSCKSAALVEIARDGTTIEEAAAGVRALVRRSVADAVGRWSPRSAGIVTAILIGDRAGLDEDVERRLQEAGTYHVIAISGGNIAILAGLLLALLRIARVPWRLVAVIVSLVLAAYAQVAGGSASVSRATLAAIAYLGARALDLRPPATNALGIAALLILLHRPLAVFDGGLALSFGATLGIIVGVGRLGIRSGSRVQRVALDLLASTICAEAALAPVGARLFSRVSVAGLALNFLAIPLMTIAQIAGLALLIVRPVDPDLAARIGQVAHLAALGLVESTRLLDLAPWLSWRVPPPGGWLIAGYYAGLTMWLVGRRPRVRRTAAATTAIAAAVMLAPAGTVPLSPSSWFAPRSLRVTVLDVGQGDAILVQLPSRRTLLVDAGGAPGSRFDVGERVVGPALRALGIARVDYFAVTHGDPDHIGGAQAILRDHGPREIWEGVPVPRSEPLRALTMQAAQRRAVWRTVQAGDGLRDGDVEVHVHHPPPPDWERQQVRNDDSLVIELRYGGVSILLTGDIGREVEATLVDRLQPAALRVLKAPHHGSATSSSPAFLAALRPDAVVISAGRDNRYGHPAPAVLRRYEEAGAAIFRTDQDGMVMLDTNGHDVRVTTFTGRRVTLGPRTTKSSKNAKGTK